MSPFGGSRYPVTVTIGSVNVSAGNNQDEIVITVRHFKEQKNIEYRDDYLR